MAANLEIQVTANTKQATDAIKGIGTALPKVEVGVKQLSGSMGQLGHSLTGLQKSTAGTTTTLVNFSRVIQDAPFGIMGIANNIDPLINSFQNLSRESGGAGKALKTLLSGLAGPAGIALAVSAATSLFIAFGDKIGDFFTPKVSEAAKAQKELAEELSKAKASAISTGVSLQQLVRIAGDMSVSDTVRKNALKELNDTTEQYGITITKAGIASGAAASQVAQLTTALIAQAVAAKLSDRIAEKYIKQADAIAEIAKQQKLLANAQKQVEGLNRSTGAQEMGQGEFAVTARDVAQKKLNQSVTDYKKITDELRQSYGLLNAETVKGLAFTDASTKEGGRATESTKRQTQAIKEQVDALAAMRRENEAMRKIADVALLSRPAPAVQDFRSAPDMGGDVMDNPATLIELLKGPAFTDATKNLAEMDTIAMSIGQNLTQAFEGVFNAIGSGNGAIETIMKSIKQLVVRLIAAAAAAAVLKALLPGATAGMAFKDIFGKLAGINLPGRAAGGPVSAGAAYVVGEKGPELFLPNHSGVIIPNGASTMTALGGGGNVRVMGMIRGNDIYISNNNARASVGRLFG